MATSTVGADNRFSRLALVVNLDLSMVGGARAALDTWSRSGLGAADLAEHITQRGAGRVAAPDVVGSQPGPSGLVRGAEPGAAVAVEVLVEDQVVSPRRV